MGTFLRWLAAASVCLTAYAVAVLGPVKTFLAVFNSPLGFHLYHRKMLEPSPALAPSTIRISPNIIMIFVRYTGDANVGYILYDSLADVAVFVDPADPTKFIAALEAVSATAKISVLTTHKHWDHAAGNAMLRKVYPGLQVYGSKIDFAEYPVNFTFELWHGVNTRLSDNERFSIGAFAFKAVLVPCHTMGSMLYLLDLGNVKNKVADIPSVLVFTGDSLFVAGCGKYFEGNGTHMHSVVKVCRREIPNDAWIMPGHDYAVSNLKFALSLEPESTLLKEKYREALLKSETNHLNIPTAFSSEQSYNPFLRASLRDPSHQNLALWKSVYYLSQTHPKLSNKVGTVAQVLEEDIRSVSEAMEGERNALMGSDDATWTAAEIEVLTALRTLKDDFKS